MILDLTEEERELIGYYRNANQEHKGMAFNMLRYASDEAERKQKSKTGCKVLAFKSENVNKAHTTF